MAKDGRWMGVGAGGACRGRLWPSPWRWIGGLAVGKERKKDICMVWMRWWWMLGMEEVDLQSRCGHGALDPGD